MPGTAASRSAGPIGLHAGPITLYAQLASIFRDRVLTGVWRSGDEVPTLEQLVSEFGVARVTVRQAIQMLSDEGLLSSQRGRRTFVTFAPIGMEAPLFSSTGPTGGGRAAYSIRILSHQRFDALPVQFASVGRQTQPYMRIRKVDGLDGAPYTVSDNYVALSLYKRIPSQAESRVKLSRLVRDNARPPVTSALERITIGLATYEEAAHLQVPVGSPVAHVTRAFLSQDSELLYLGILAYRGDRFSIERDISYAVACDRASRGAATDPGPLMTSPPITSSAMHSVR